MVERHKSTSMENEQAPLLSLRMKNSLSGCSCKIGADDAVDILRVMISQEPVYQCRDYLGRRETKAHGDSFLESSYDDTSLEGDDGVDITCREKMCEWSYRVCDHFHTNREIVALSFSFLDRFIDRYSCDRTAFKLASMTTLFMATKFLNAKQISIISLAELSRGEFGMSHLAEMERLILEALEWRLCPPTLQSYVGYLLALLPIEDSGLARRIYQRAVFFGELCVYDYTFVTQERPALAVACILSALEGMDDEHLSQELQRCFLDTILLELSLEFPVDELEKCQGRLWYLYSCSAQVQEDDILPIHVSEERLVKYRSEQHSSDVDGHSPVSVNLQH